MLEESQESISEFDKKIVALLETLLEAYKTGFSFSSSPVSLTLRVVIDLVLKLKNMFQEGRQRWHHAANKSIKFMDGISAPWVPDELGNPRQISSRVLSKTADDPQLAEFFGKLALDLVQIQRLESLPEHLYCFEQKPQSKKKIKPASYHFFRRTRKR